MHLSVFRWSYQVMHLIILDAMERFPPDAEAGSPEACFRVDVVELVVVVLSDLLRSQPVRKRGARETDFLIHMLQFDLWREDKTKLIQGLAMAPSALMDQIDLSRAINFILQTRVFENARSWKRPGWRSRVAWIAVTSHCNGM